MTYFFVGSTQGNSGPEQVNKKLINCFDKDFKVIRMNNRITKAWDIVFKTISSDIIIISGLSGPGKFCAKLAKKLKKPVIYMMHGCVEYESKINGFSNSEKAIKIEREIMYFADLILSVSELFCEWTQEHYPKYKNKINYLYNGVESFQNKYIKAPNEDVKTVIAIGGNRRIKNNIPVSVAIEQLEGVELKIYGKVYSELPLANNTHTSYCGEISPEELYIKMGQADLFVLNSIFETFSLAVIEALNNGCSVLVSSKAGVTRLLSLKDEDIINDPNDDCEIKEKIRYLLQHPNCDRILSNIDYEELSYENEVRKLKSIANSLIGN